MSFTVKFLKVRDVKDPVRGTEQAAGIDFFVPVYNDDFINALCKANSTNAAFDEVNCRNIIANSQVIRLFPGERILIPSGIKTYFEPKDSALIAANKSGVATKKGLRFTAQVVDSDYTGEIHIGVANDSTRPVDIAAGDKLIQFLHQPVFLSKLEEFSTKEEFDALHNGSTRGEGGFGSTDKNIL
jgi:dUTP pyrophosphatase